MATRVVSFGYARGAPPGQPVVVVDLRNEFRNPFHNPRLRSLAGTDPRVAADVMKTVGFTEKYNRLRERVRQAPGEVWLGCTGGQHRSVFLAERIGYELGIPVHHRDLDR